LILLKIKKDIVYFSRTANTYPCSEEKVFYIYGTWIFNINFSVDKISCKTLLNVSFSFSVTVKYIPNSELEYGRISNFWANFIFPKSFSSYFIIRSAFSIFKVRNEEWEILAVAIIASLSCPPVIDKI
jgi:hypothetical protein